MAYEFTKAALYGIKTFNEKAKEKTRMEKLIELLNEYENQLDLKGCTRSEQPNFIGHIKAVSEYSDNILYNADLAVTSKRYGFIKWLVDNDKINRDKVDDKFERPFFGYTNYEIVLMLLSISDTPIEDLISYLK